MLKSFSSQQTIGATMCSEQNAIILAKVEQNSGCDGFMMGMGFGSLNLAAELFVDQPEMYHRRVKLNQSLIRYQLETG
jgi:hypothetical protein